MQQIWFTAVGVYIGVLMAAATVWFMIRSQNVYTAELASWPLLAAGAIPPLLMAGTFAFLKAYG